MSSSKRLFEYFSKSAFYIKISKFAAIILFLIFSISCVIIFRNDITVENIQLLTKFITLDGSSSHYSDEFSVTVKEESDVIMLRDNVAIINNNNISLHDLSGRKLFSYNYSMTSPAVSHDDHYILIYDIGEKEACVFNSFSKIKTFKFDFPIYSADIRGDYVAFVTGNDLSRSSLSVYKFDNREKDYVLNYNKLFDKFINNASLSDNGKNVLVSSVSSNNGKYDCNIMIFDCQSDSSTPSETYSTVELPIKTYFNSNASNALSVTDSSVHFFDKNLDVNNSYLFNQSKVSSFYFDNNYLVISEKNNLAGNSNKITIFSSEGNTVRTINIPDEIYDITIGHKYIYALGKEGVYRYSVLENNKSDDTVFPIEARYHSIICDTADNCYLVGYTLISKVNF